MWRTLALGIALLSGCGDDTASGACNTLSESECGGRSDCLPLMAYDVTSTNSAGTPCWRGPAGDWGDPVYLRCVLRPGGTSGDIRFAADPDTDRCYAFTSGTLVPSGWRECADVLAECTCRSDADCPSGEGCVFYGDLEQRCRPRKTSALACSYDVFPVTGDPCPDSQRESGTVCRPYYCDRDCAPTCTCGAGGTWTCAPETCIAGPDAGRPECGTPPRCALGCL